MTSTKKGLMLAGSIVGIVEAAVMILMSIIIFASIGMVNEEFILATLEAESSAVTFTPEEMMATISLTKTLLGIMGAYVLIMSAVMLALSIVVMAQRRKGVSKKGTIIALIVISALNANLVTAGFMIACLCIKDKTPQQIVEENMPHQN